MAARLGKVDIVIIQIREGKSGVRVVSESALCSMSHHQVHVWYVRLTATERHVTHFYRTCSHDEQVRADKFYDKRHREWFIVCRGLLRALLGWYRRLNPEDICFGYGPKGKPFLRNSVQPPLFFNVAHCENRALLAFSDKFELGADLERVRPLSDAESIARHFFSEQEYSTLLSVDPVRRMEAFFNCWTRKEAYLKARGDGLSGPLNEFAVSLGPGQRAAFLKLRDGVFPIREWSLIHRDFESSHVAAIALPTADYMLRQWQFETPEQLLQHLETREFATHVPE